MALTLPSSSSNNEQQSLFIISNGQKKTNLNGALTKTTSTLTPTRLKNIEEQEPLIQQQSSQKPFVYDYMARFVPPTVNIKLHLQQQQQSSSNQQLNEKNNNTKTKSTIDYYSSNSNSNSNSNDSCFNNYMSDDYTNSSETNNSFQSNSSSANTTFIQHKLVPIITMPTDKMRSKSRLKSNESQKNWQSIRSSLPKRSNAGGRKPNSSQNLTNDELLKRQKRRERNKLAAARCRKKRVDQTNYLIDETKELEKKHQELMEIVDDYIKQFNTYKDILQQHQSQCTNENIFKMDNKIISQIDLASIRLAMESITDHHDPDLDNSIDLNQPNTNTTTTSTTTVKTTDDVEFTTHQHPPPKRKRPNSLSIRPMMIDDEQRKINTTTTTTTTTRNNDDNNITPSSGFNNFADLGLTEPTGLTPLNPTISTVDITPSTMNAFLKSLDSPFDNNEQRKLLSM